MAALSLVVSFFIVLISLVANAQSKPKTKVIFFGGYASTATQMKCWEDGARRQGKFNQFDFRGVPYPGKTSYDKYSAVKGAAQTLQQIKNEIDSNPDQKYIIVGHSSGSALANWVADKVSVSSRIKLFNLDGFTPSTQLQRKVDTTCVSAKHGPSLSRNILSMKQCENSTTYLDSHCTTAWCLHFSLVDKSTPSNLDRFSFNKKGYNRCETNLDWLPVDFDSPAPRQIRGGARR